MTDPTAQKPRSATRQRPWSWRLGYNHGLFDVPRGVPTFHAYDVNDSAACDAGFGLAGTIEQPNEGSHFCPRCILATAELPEGRAKWVYVDGKRTSSTDRRR